MRQVEQQAAGAAPRSGLGKMRKHEPPLDGGAAEDFNQSVIARRRRYRLQRRARYVLRDERRVNRKGQLAPYRVTACQWARCFDKDGLGVRIVKTSEGSTYRGLQRCGSVWHCPDCAARIANHRREDIKAAEDAARGTGYKVLFGSVTFSHNNQDDLEALVEAMSKAWEAVWRGTPADRLRGRYKILGHIRAVEATHGDVNGWHPHIHFMLFVEEDCDIEGLRCDLGARWERCAARFGLTMNEHGFDLIDDTKRLADYIAKFGHEPRWRTADELARWHTKIGRGRRRNEHYTPWQLLEFADAGDERAAELFREYARVFHGRRQLVWSRGLREALGLEEELTDEEAVELEQEATEELEVYIPDEEWSNIRRCVEVDQGTGEVLRDEDRRAEAVELVDQNDTPEAIQQAFATAFGFSPVVVRTVRGRRPDIDGQGDSDGS